MSVATTQSQSVRGMVLLWLLGGLAVIALLSVAMWSGCEPTLGTVYGRRTYPGAKSVNGTAVLADMFQQAGHRVHSWPFLSPRLEEADCIVWIPDAFEPPSDDALSWLQDWLTFGGLHSNDKGERTLIYVGRDYDAESAYWSKVANAAPADQRAEINRRLSSAQRHQDGQRASLPAQQECEWFTVEWKVPSRSIERLDGPWSRGIDVSKVEVELNGRIRPHQDAEVLLRSKDDVLVSRRRMEGTKNGQLIIVANGSFLLNLPLVNHEHRVWAGRLVDAIGEPKKRVAFLETGPEGPTISEDPENRVQTGLGIFSVWPINVIALHVAVIGALFCCARWPIFGTARSLQPDATTDFGKHVSALGGLLAKTRDRDYARDRIRHWDELQGQRS